MNQLGVKLAVGWSGFNFFQYQKTEKAEKNVMTIIVFISVPTKFIYFFSYRQRMYLWVHLSTSLFQMFTSKQSRDTYQVPEERGHSQNCIGQQQILALGHPSPRMICAGCKASTAFINLNLFISNSVSTTQIYYSSSPSVKDRRSFLSKVKRNKTTVDGSFRYLEVRSR